MSVPKIEDVKAVLTPFHSRIANVIIKGWEEWAAVSRFRMEQGYSPTLYSRTRANYVFDAIARYAVEEFGDDPSINVVVEAQTVKFVFNGKVLGRFKKGDENNLSRNAPTQASLAFADPEAIFPEMPPETAKIDFIWAANDLGTKLERVLVVARNGYSVLWEYSLEFEMDDTQSVIEFAKEPHYAPPSDGGKLVTPKTSDKIKRKE